ncbi:MAG: cell division protein FtsQ/DivIB [Candidatus Limimorpha sp.]
MMKLIKISVWCVTVIAMVILWCFTFKSHNDNTLKGVELSLIQSGERGFIVKDDEYHTIMNICDTAHNKNIKMLPVDSVRKYVESIPWVVSSDTGLTLNGILVVNMTECEPVMRVYNNKGESVYVDEQGNIFPVRDNYTPHVLVGSGKLNFKAPKSSSNIYDNVYCDSDLRMIFDVMKSVLNNSYSRCCVKQVYYERNNIELVLNNADTRVIIGDKNNIDKKLMNMKYFFDHMQGSPEMQNYSMVNFNFLNQVVCTKK